VTEADLQRWVLGLARELQLLTFHSADPRRDLGPGFPDLVIAGPRGILLAELKAPGYRLSEDQKRWGHMLKASGQPWRCWYPADWHDGGIERDLRAIAWPLV